ncbi:MSHA biogenesis protein MshQ [Marinobacter nauticus]|nr:MSHA biogenesis protein MshQ [Marinobacter nauticus]
MIRQGVFLKFCQALCLVLVAIPGIVVAQTVQTFTEPGEGTFSVPENVSRITVEVWGAGGGGGSISRGIFGSGQSAGGGGGGAYASSTFTVTSGDSFRYSVGRGGQSNQSGGDSSFGGGGGLVLARGGAGGSNNVGTGAAGGAVPNSIGDLKYAGGRGADAPNNSGGGGGGSAGEDSSGNPGSGSSGGSVVSGGGAGGSGGYGGGGIDGGSPGGGGGGAQCGFLSFCFSALGGPGGDGQIRITYQVTAQCSAIFDASDGINENVPPNKRLDLSVFEPRNPQPWPGNNVIPAGNSVYQARTFNSNNISFSVDGQARVLVDGDLTIGGNNFTMNADGNARDLLLIVDGNLTFRNNAEINAVIYATGNIDFGNNAVIVGALAAEGQIDIGGGQSNVIYDPNAINQVNFGGACIPEEPTIVLDHIRIIHPGVGLTCQASDLELLACANADCSSLYPDPVDLTLQPAGWLPAQNVTLTGAADLQFQRSTEEAVTLSVSSASPAPDNGVVCLAPDGSGSCDITFRDVGFVFEMPQDLIAGEQGRAFSMSALETDEQSGQCKALFAGQTKTIEFGTGYLNPGVADRVVTWPTRIGGIEVATNGSPQMAVPITFDDDGVARNISILYNDAGRNSLLARYTEANQPDGGTLVIEGATNYVMAPRGLCLIPERQCTSSDLGCSNTLSAGVPFNVTPRAYRDAPGVASLSCADKPPAPSFILGSVPVSHQLEFPAAGVEGNLLEATLDYGDGAQSLTLTEVGIFSVGTQAVSGGYLGRDVPASDQAMTARMIPDQLSLTVIGEGELSPECGGFAYTGQTFGWDASGIPELRIEALNGQVPRQLTRNYTHPDVIVQLPANRFEVLVPNTDNVQTLDDGAGTPVPFRRESGASELSAGNRDSETDGIVRYRFNDADQFVYPKSAASRIAPFSPELTFLLQPMTDADNVPVTGIAAGGEPINPIAAFPVRYGRLSPQNVYGPENIEMLQMPLQMEYWNGTRFVLSDDSPGCTPWNTDNITSNTSNHHNLVTASGSFVDGLGGPLVLEANGSEGTDTLVWGGVEDWKKDDLDGDGNLDDPTATATFGVYRGHDRVIYWRER